MKEIKFLKIIFLVLVTILFFILVMTACSSLKQNVSDPNIGKIVIEITVETGKDSIARTPDGNGVGRIDKDGVIYDQAGNKIGHRKPTTEELIRQYGY
jgi:hypothetical protein